MKIRFNIEKKKTKRIIYNILFVSVLILALSCSAQKSYDVLTIFFDDVPLPDSTRILRDTLNLAIIDTSEDKNSEQAGIEITHPPAEEGSCNNCHDTGNSFALTEKPPKLCYNCHDDFTKKYIIKHGPVIIGSCTVCHDPHKSMYQPLIRINGQDLCYICHEKNDVMKNDVHTDIGDTKCWECHNPHGGSDRTFLK